MLASILLKEDEELTAEVLEGAVRALRRIHLRRRQEEVQQELKKPGLAADQQNAARLCWQKWSESSRALRDPESGRRRACRMRLERRKQLETKRLLADHLSI